MSDQLFYKETINGIRKSGERRKLQISLFIPIMSLVVSGFFVMLIVYTVCSVVSVREFALVLKGVTPILFFVGFVAEIVCSILWGKGKKEKYCLFFSSSLFFYLGNIIDFIRSFHADFYLHIPG